MIEILQIILPKTISLDKTKKYEKSPQAVFVTKNKHFLKQITITKTIQEEAERY